MDNSTKTKLYILLGLVLAVIVFVCVMYSQIPVFSEEVLTTSSFKEEVILDAKKNIPSEGSSFATSQYRQMVDEITTEDLLGKLSKPQKDSCLSIANTAVIQNIFNVSRQIMKSGKWNSATLASVESNCKFAMSMRDVSSSQKSTMSGYLSTIGKYHSACGVCGASHRYNGEEGNRNLIEKAKAYMADASLKSCRELMTNLQSVRGNLYQAHLAHVKASRSYEACDGFVNMASVYGKSTDELKGIVITIRGNGEAVNKKKPTKDDVADLLRELEEDD